MRTQKICPLTKTLCEGSGCEWWTITPELMMMDNPDEDMDSYGNCALKVIAEHLITQ